MTLISLAYGNRVIMRDGKIGTEQECCCCPCFIEGLPISVAACPLPEFYEQTCADLEARFLHVKGQFEAAGYTVTMRELTGAELPDCDPVCGYEMSFTCDSCSEQWFQPFFPEPYGDPDPADFYLIDPGPPSDFLDVSAFSIAMTCPPDGQVYPLQGYPGNLIAFYSAIDGQPAQFIPYCGNPLP